LDKKTCYGCFFEVSLKCHWFHLNQGKRPKQIPEETLKVGCNHYKNNASIGYKAGNKLTDKIINTFDGEIIGDKYKPPVKPTKTYKRKYVKSPHKYAYRRDAQ
tara:strand:- start:154 stop:462 length:309 start_codon:yes stop_codon:yes gene_type:complete